METGFYQNRTGYSLIELMFVIAIMAVVAAIAIPLYQHYIQEAQEASIEESLHEIREVLSVYVVTHGQLPANNKQAGIPEYAAGFDLLMNTGGNKPQTGSISANIGKKLAFVIDLQVKNNSLIWTCTPATQAGLASNQIADQSNIPAECKTTSTKPIAKQQQTQPQTVPPQSPLQVSSQKVAGTKCAADEDKITASNSQTVCVKKCVTGEHRNTQGVCVSDTVKEEKIEPEQAPQVAAVDVTICPDDQQLDQTTNTCVSKSQCPPGFTPAKDDQAVSIQFASMVGSSLSIMHKQNPYFGHEMISSISGNEDLSSKKALLTTGKEAGLSCHLCRGPKFICERSHAPQKCSIDGDKGTKSNPYIGCINDIENLIDGSRYISRRCATLDDMKKDFEEKYKGKDQCIHYGERLVDRHFFCSFGCIGDNCNMKTVPDTTVSEALLDSIPKFDSKIQPVCVPK